jgi:hypothetical protein
MPGHRICQATDDVAIERIAGNTPGIFGETPLAARVKSGDDKALGHKTKLEGPIVRVA